MFLPEVDIWHHENVSRPDVVVKYSSLRSLESDAGEPLRRGSSVTRSVSFVIHLRNQHADPTRFRAELLEFRGEKRVQCPPPASFSMPVEEEGATFPESVLYNRRHPRIERGENLSGCGSVCRVSGYMQLQRELVVRWRTETGRLAKSLHDRGSVAQSRT